MKHTFIAVLLICFALCMRSPVYAEGIEDSYRMHNTSKRKHVQRKHRHHKKTPEQKAYEAEFYKNKLFWNGFNDPVPRSNTSRYVDDHNYRIIRQMERERIRKGQ